MLILVNFIYCFILSLMVGENKNQVNEDVYLRIARVFCIPIVILLLWDCYFFLKLKKQLAPLFDNLSNIMVDIIPFLNIMTIIILVFAFSFFIIGQNQYGFDLSKAEIEEVEKDSNKSNS